MRSLVAVCVLAVAFVVFGAVTANAADLQQGQVPDQTLAAMGLGGMERLSDAQGQQIRGKSYAIGGNFIFVIGNIYIEHSIVVVNITQKAIVGNKRW
jgi:hypothetical protein